MDMEKKSPLRDVMNSTMEKVREMVDANNIVGAPITTPGRCDLDPHFQSQLRLRQRRRGLRQAWPEQFRRWWRRRCEDRPVAFLVIKDGTTRVMPVAVPPVSTVDRLWIWHRIL